MSLDIHHLMWEKEERMRQGSLFSVTDQHLKEKFVKKSDEKNRWYLRCRLLWDKRRKLLLHNEDEKDDCLLKHRKEWSSLLLCFSLVSAPLDSSCFSPASLLQLLSFNFSFQWLFAWQTQTRNFFSRCFFLIQAVKRRSRRNVTTTGEIIRTTDSLCPEKSPPDPSFLFGQCLFKLMVMTTTQDLRMNKTVSEDEEKGKEISDSCSQSLVWEKKMSPSEEEVVKTMVSTVYWWPTFFMLRKIIIVRYITCP